MNTLATTMATYNSDLAGLTLRNSFVLVFLIAGAVMIVIATILLWNAPEPTWLALWGRESSFEADPNVKP